MISGYLITTLVKDGIERGDFSFANFYFRRAKRILPAAYVTFLCTALLAPVFLASSEMNDLRAQMAGSVAFMSNIVLWRQSGYFEGEAALKPLLHVWSLSIEEQYYFLLPALLFFVPRRFWKRAAIVLLLASLTLCLYMVHWKPTATFFLLPTRGWEMALGSVGALILVGKRLECLLKFVFWPALAVLLTLPVVKIANYHPGPDAMLICVATLVIILRKHPLLFRGPVMHGTAKIGDISYSLYLVHWPLFAFLNNAWLGKEISPLPIRLGILILSLVLAWAMNRYVEEPIRRMEIKPTRRVLARTVAASLTLVMLPLGINHAVATEKDYAHIRRHNYGFGRGCSFEGDRFEPSAECRNSDQPEILVWGDSFAIHLIPGILGTEGDVPAIAQATRSNCGPLLGDAYTNANKNQMWAKSCIAFNDSVITYLAKADSVQTVVLSSPFGAYVDENNILLKKNYSDGSYHLMAASQAEAVAGLKKTVETVRSLDKKVVVIAPPPSSGVDIGRCLERYDNGLLVLGVKDQCQISVESWTKEQGTVIRFLAALPVQADVEVISLGDYLCGSGMCKTAIDDTFIYRDAGHLSYDGSVFLANKMRWVEKIQELAR